MSEGKSPETTNIAVPFLALTTFPDLEHRPTGIMGDDGKEIVETRVKSEYVEGKTYTFRGNHKDKQGEETKPRMSDKLTKWAKDGKILLQGVMPK